MNDIIPLSVEDNFMFLSPIPIDLICGACNKILKNPICVPCGCRFCRQCIENYFQLNGEHVKCLGIGDDCSTTILTKFEIQTDFAAYRNITNISVKCKKCLDKLILKDVNDHHNKCRYNFISTDCMFSKIGCKTPNKEINDVNSHLLTDTVSHSTLLVDQIVCLQRQIKEIQQTYDYEIKKLKEQISILSKTGCESNGNIGSEIDSNYVTSSSVTGETNNKLELFSQVSETSTVESTVLPNKKSKKNKKAKKNEINEALNAASLSLENKNLGNEHFKLQKYESALTYYNKALDLCPANEKKEKAFIHQNLSATYEKLGQFSEAMTHINLSLSLMPKYEKALYRRSKLYKQMDKYQESLNDSFAAAYFDNFKTMNFVKHLDETMEAAVGCGMAEWDKRNDNHLQSDYYIKQYMEQFPNDVLLVEESIDYPKNSKFDKFKKCLQLYREGHYGDCYRLQEKVLEKDTLPEPDSHSILLKMLLLRATLLMVSCQDQEAFKILIKMINIPHSDKFILVSALNKFSLLCSHISNEKEATKAVSYAIQLNPKLPDSFYRRGCLKFAELNYEDAHADFSTAVALDPKFAKALVHKEFMKFKITLENISFAELGKLMQIFPDNEDCCVLNMKALIEVGRIDVALKVGLSFMSHTKDAGCVFNHVAMIFTMLDEYESSKNVCIDGLRNSPKYAPIYQTLTKLSVQESDLVNAVKYIEKAVRYSRFRSERCMFISTHQNLTAQLHLSRNFGIKNCEVLADMFKSIQSSSVLHRLSNQFPDLLS